MSAVDDVKGVLKTKQGKVVAVAAAGGLVYLYWSRGRSAGTTPDDPGTVTTTDRVPGAAGGGGTSGTVDTGRPTDNNAWLQRAVSVLTNPPYNYDSGAVYNALAMALGGQQLTPAQQAIVSQAISVAGSPPEGMPPTNATAPPVIKSPGDTPHSTGPLPAGTTLEGLATDYWARPDWAYKIYYANVSTIENAAIAAGHKDSGNGSFLAPGINLDIPPV